MGNSITKSSTDLRFGDSLLAKEIKSIIMDYSYSDDYKTIDNKNIKTNDIYNDTYKNIKPNLAKACCKEVIYPGVSLAQNKIVSIPFPDPSNLTTTRCTEEGICLGTDYVGLQIDDERAKYCGDGSKVGIAGYNFTTMRDGVSNSVCDNYMIDYCAKSLYEQGCLAVNTNSAGKPVPQFSDTQINKLCLTADKKNYAGPPECQCLNSMFGYNLNSAPAKKIGGNTSNPYNLDGLNTMDGNTITKYSLDIFKNEPAYQKPRALDKRCTTASDGGNSGRASAYTLVGDNTGSLTICLNQINILDSNVGEANIAYIKQSNNCGNPTPPPKTTGLPTAAVTTPVTGVTTPVTAPVTPLVTTPVTPPVTTPVTPLVTTPVTTPAIAPVTPPVTTQVTIPSAEIAKLAEQAKADQAKADQARLAAEQARIAAEQTKADQAKAEQARIAAEQAKIAEQDRIAGERMNNIYLYSGVIGLPIFVFIFISLLVWWLYNR